MQARPPFTLGNFFSRLAAGTYGDFNTAKTVDFSLFLWILPSPKFGNRYRDPQTASELLTMLSLAFINFPASPRHLKKIDIQH